MAKLIDLNGKVFGFWEVLHYSHAVNFQSYWLCRCKCGTEKPVHSKSLRSGSSASCGCNRGNLFSQNTRKLDRENHLLRSEYAAMLRRHQSKDSSKPISFECFSAIVKLPCKYCLRTKSKQVKDHSSRKGLVSDFVLEINGIDRIDPSLGYIVGNIQSCCFVCNRAKGDMSNGEFLEWISLVHGVSND